MASATQAGPRGELYSTNGRPVAALPPGPRGPAMLHTLIWAFAPTWMMRRCASSVGDAFTLTFAPSGLQLVFVSDPGAVKDVMTAPAEIAPSGAAGSPVAAVMGPSSVVVLIGPEHMRQRKLLLPPFHGERMREYEETIVEATRAEMAGFPLGRPMPMQPHSRRITLEVILRAVFGVEAERMEPLRRAIGELLEPGHTLLLLRTALSRRRDTPQLAGFAATLERLDRLLYSEIALRREQADLDSRSDILSLLLQARDEQGTAMSDSELRDELVTLLLAGHETTSTSVAWALERLVRHPAKLERLVREIDAGESEQYLDAVVNETLRVRPVVPLVARVLTSELRVGEMLLPAGTRVAPCIYLANRNPGVYEDPAAFRPERFLDSAPETFSWIPFGGGIRRCIGASFAQFEMRAILRTLLAELRPSRPRGPLWRRGEWVRRRAVTLVPAAGGRVVWQRRRDRTGG